jgi:hypothetical protein
MNKMLIKISQLEPDKLPDLQMTELLYKNLVDDNENGDLIFVPSKTKYFFLLVPMLLIGIFLVYYLPVSQRTYVLLVPIIFWIIYYTWIYIEKRLMKKT